MTYLTHDGHFIPFERRKSPWRIGPAADFRPLRFGANAMIAMASAIAVGWLINSRVRSIGLSFTVREALVVTGLIALGVYYVSNRWRLHQSQATAVGDRGYCEWNPSGPDWLRQLTGEWLWEWGDQLVAASVDWQQIEKTPRKGSIKVLYIHTVRCDEMPSMDSFPSLRAIDMKMVNYDYSEFPGGEEPEVWRCLRAIACCKTLEGLNLYEAGVTNRGLAEISDMPAIKHLHLAGNPEINDDGLHFLKSLTTLRRLDLLGTSATETGVQDLRNALPHCEIFWNDVLPY